MAARATHRLRKRVEHLARGTEVTCDYVEPRKGHFRMAVPVRDGERKPMEATWVSVDDLEEIE